MPGTVTPAPRRGEEDAASDTAIRQSRGTALLWSVAEGGGLTMVSLVALVAFARLLTPAEVGTVAIALSIVQILSLPVDTLFGDALVQRPELRHRHFDAAFTVSTALGIAIAGLCWAGEPVVTSLLRAASGGDGGGPIHGRAGAA